MLRKLIASAVFPRCLIAGISLLSLGSTAYAQQTQTCEEALSTPGGAISLADGTTVALEQGVDQWESDIVKLRVSHPGLLVLDGEDHEAEASLWATDPVSAAPRLLDGAQVGSAHRPLTAVVRPGEQCLQVTPPAGAIGSLGLQATFIDVCGLGPQDDHGDSFLCATEIGLGESRSGSITAADLDLFSFVLAAATDVTIALSGTTDVSANLYLEDGSLTVVGALGLHSLAAGRYFVRIASHEGAEGPYVITLNPE